MCLRCTACADVPGMLFCGAACANRAISSPGDVTQRGDLSPCSILRECLLCQDGNEAADFPPMNISKANKVVIIGPPGCGKGTQARCIEQRFGYKHISTGSILRAEKEKAEAMDESMRTPEQREILECMSRGDFVSDETIWGLLRDAMKGTDRFLLDGFPRNTSQVPKVCADMVILISLDPEECVRRICARRDGRPDDSEEIARYRIETYVRETMPVVEYYRSKGILASVDGSQDIDSVTRSIFSLFLSNKT